MVMKNGIKHMEERVQSLAVRSSKQTMVDIYLQARPIHLVVVIMMHFWLRQILKEAKNGCKPTEVLEQTMVDP